VTIPRHPTPYLIAFVLVVWLALTAAARGEWTVIVGTVVLDPKPLGSSVPPLPSYTLLERLSPPPTVKRYELVTTDIEHDAILQVVADERQQIRVAGRTGERGGRLIFMIETIQPHREKDQ
jgi:hypothetical protein